LLIRRLTWLCGLAAVTWVASAALTSSLAFAASPPAPTITLSVNSGRTGTPVTITGSGWPASELVVLYVDLPAPYLSLPLRVDAQGSFRLDTKWPDKNYDTSGHVDPTTPGAHKVCGDTIYPGSTAIVSTRACSTTFQVLASASPAPAVGSSGASLPELLLALTVLIVVIGGTVLWMRRSP
jgi:hypothetical protein